MGRKSFEEIENFSSRIGVHTTYDEYLKNYPDNMMFEDQYGYLYNIKLKYLIENEILKYSLAKFGRGNKNTIYNIKLWLILNNKNIKLLSEYWPKEKRPNLIWRCSNLNCMEIFDMPWENIRHGCGCPYCAVPPHRIGKKNNLAFKYPDIAKDWNYIKNVNITPYDIAPFSNQKLWWICPECGNDNWFVEQSSRINAKIKCPICSGRSPTKENNLASIYPYLIDDWDYELNKKLPNEYMPHSGKKVHWICNQCGRKWEASIDSRSKGSGCSLCGSSGGAKIIYHWLTNNNYYFDYDIKKFNDLIGPNGGKLRYDFIIYENYNKSEIKALIEFDGIQHDEYRKYFHKTENEFEISKTRDIIKNEYASKNNYKLIRIKYRDVDKNDINKIEEILSKELGV
jgi:hypothetical protein